MHKSNSKEEAIRKKRNGEKVICGDIVTLIELEPTIY